MIKLNLPPRKASSFISIKIPQHSQDSLSGKSHHVSSNAATLRQNYSNSNRVKTHRKNTKQQKSLKSDEIAYIDGDNQIADIKLLQKQVLKTSASNNRLVSILLNEVDALQEIIHKLSELFDLYIKQEILKFYCLKLGWKIQKRILDTLVKPTFDLLAISREKLSEMFEPFLHQLTSKYILHTQLDIYSRMSPYFLLIQIIQIWLRIKQSEIVLKREIRNIFPLFSDQFCIQQNGKYKINRSELFHRMFDQSNGIRMVNLIKIYIFCYKCTGERDEECFKKWIQQY